MTYEIASFLAMTRSGFFIKCDMLIFDIVLPLKETMKLRYWLTCLVLFLLTESGHAQFDVYACLTNGRLVSIDYTTCSYTLIANTEHFEDIALSPTGTMYGVAGDGLYKINPKTGESVILGNCPVINSLVFDRDGYLYGANNYLYQLDTTNANALTLGGLIDRSAGDLTFFDGVMYMSALGGDLVQISYKRSQPNSATSKRIGNMGIKNMLGILTVFTGINNDIDYKMLGFAGYNAYEINMLDGTATIICQGMVPGEFLGAASQAESWGGIQKRRKICRHDSTQLVSVLPGLDSLVWQLPVKDSIGKNKTFEGKALWAKDTGYYLIYKDTTVVDTFHIGYYPLPDIGLQPGVVLCHEQIYTRTEAGFTYEWISLTEADSLVDTLSPGIVARPYRLVVSSEYGCIDSADMMLPVYAPLQVKLKQEYLACKGKRTRLSATAKGGIKEQYKYTWNTGDSDKPFIEITAEKPRWVRVQLSDNCMPAVADSIYLEVLPSPEADFEAIHDSLSDELVVYFENRSEGATSYSWTFSDSSGGSNEISPTRLYTENGIYTVGLVAANDEGCTDTVYKEIEIILQSHLYVPTAFTPNKDAKNDVYKLKGYGIREIYWEIYNRWGELVFSSNSLEDGWDGHYRGGIVPDGIYIIQINAKGNYQNFNETALLKVLK